MVLKKWFEIWEAKTKEEILDNFKGQKNDDIFLSVNRNKGLKELKELKELKDTGCCEFTDTLAKSSASNLVTVLRWRKSDLFPTIVTQASGSA